MNEVREASNFLPRTVSLPGKAIFFEGLNIDLSLNTGLCVFVGANGSGKSEVLRWLRDYLRSNCSPPTNRKVVYLASGRNSILESFRSAGGMNGPGHINRVPAAIGNQGWTNQWESFEGNMGMLLRLKERADLLLKIEARLQALYQRRLKLDWIQAGLRVEFSPLTGGPSYYANAEASGILELIRSA
jgi:hypothetical protein